MFKSKKGDCFRCHRFYWTSTLSRILLKDGYEVLAISRSQKRAETLPWFKDVKFVSYDFHSDQQITEVEGLEVYHIYLLRQVLSCYSNHLIQLLYKSLILPNYEISGLSGYISLKNLINNSFSLSSLYSYQFIFFKA